MNKRFDGGTKFIVGLLVLYFVVALVAQLSGVPIYVSYSWYGYDVNTHYGADAVITFPHTVPSGDDRLLVVAIGCGFNEVVNSVIWGEPSGASQALTLAESRAAAAGWKTEIWYLVGPVVRSDSIYVDIAGGHDGGVYGTFNFTDVNQDSPIGATADSSDGDAGTEPVVFLTTLYDSSFVLTACTQHGINSGPWAPSAGQVEVYDTCPGVLNWDPRSWGGYIERLSAGSQACSLDATGEDPDDDWAIVSIEIRTVPSDGSVVVAPAAAIAVGTAVDPTVVTTGSQSVEPAPAIAVAMGVDPAVGISPGGYPSGANIFYLAPPNPPTGLRAGNDGYSGSHPDTAWATLDYAESQMGAGDILYIMGGEYTNGQRMLCSFSEPGTPANPITFKAYGDAVATFTNTGQTSRGSKWYIQNSYTPGASNHTIIDGCSYLTGDSLYLHFIADTLNGVNRDQGVQYMIVWTGDADLARPDSGFVLRGCEIDGHTMDGIPSRYPYTSEGSRMQFNAMVLLNRMTDVLVEKNYIHHGNRPTGCWHDSIPGYQGMWGDSIDREQGDGQAVQLHGVKGAIIRNNRFERINHGATEAGFQVFPPPSYTDTLFAEYIQWTDNQIVQGRGGHIYVYQGTHHCLIEGNHMFHAGQSVSQRELPSTGDCRPKGKGLQISADNITIRNNVIYNPHQGGLGVATHVFQSFPYTARHVFTYNNTVYDGYSGQSYMLSQGSGGIGYARNSRIFNNIFYAANSLTPWGCASTPAAIYMWDHQQPPGVLDFIHPDDPDGCPSSTHFGGHYFHNNLMARSTEEGHRYNSADYDSMIEYAGPDYLNDMCRTYSINEIESLDATAWANNVAGRPLFASESPDDYGLFSEWWIPQTGSPAIDAGRRMTGDFLDTTGTYVGDNAHSPPSYFADYGVTTYGWSDTLAWYGSAPDIGAYEITDDTGIAPSPASAVATAIDPAVVVVGAEAVEPEPAAWVATAVDPTVELGSTSVEPVFASAVAAAMDPSIVGNIIGLWTTFGDITHGFNYRGRRF